MTSEVTAAVAVLDKHGPPDWREKLAVGGPLASISNPRDCPLTRIYGCYTTGDERLSAAVGSQYGPVQYAFVGDIHLDDWNAVLAAAAGPAPAPTNGVTTLQIEIGKREAAVLRLRCEIEQLEAAVAVLRRTS